MISKNIFFHTLTLLFVASFLKASPISITGYGVWDRSNIKDGTLERFKYLRGIRAEIKWKELQPKAGTFNWQPMLEVLQRAEKSQQYVKLNVFVGPDSPDWVYSMGAPKVVTDTDDHSWNTFPYYLSSVYKKYYFEMIQKFSLFVRGLPVNLANLVAYVQVMTGCTGDEVAYKGIPLDLSYKLTPENWSSFRLEAFQQYIAYFNNGDNGRKIPLLFNNIDETDFPKEWNWLISNIDPNVGFGIKGSAFVRGHHLNDEALFKAALSKYLVNPKGMQLFSCAEMDQTWTKTLYQKNVPLGFYWGMLSGLNTGLSVWDVTGGALDYADNSSSVEDTFRFFSKYAPQIYPSEATAAYSIFHEGLNAANEKKFPERNFTKRTRLNLERYVAICKAYESRGCRMNDLAMAAKGQVAQRDFQSGWNDVGWDIEEGNYERWIEQLLPDSTSIGLFRVRGTLDESSSINDRFARSFENKSKKNEMYFKFHDEMFPNKGPSSLTFKITWLDKNYGSKWALKYLKTSGINGIFEVTGEGDNQWKTETFLIKDAAVTKGGINGSDFSIMNTDEIDDIFHGVEVDITRNV